MKRKETTYHSLLREISIDIAIPIAGVEIRRWHTPRTRIWIPIPHIRRHVGLRPEPDADPAASLLHRVHAAAVGVEVRAVGLAGALDGAPAGRGDEVAVRQVVEGCGGQEGTLATGVQRHVVVVGVVVGFDDVDLAVGILVGADGPARRGRGRGRDQSQYVFRLSGREEWCWGFRAGCLVII